MNKNSWSVVVATLAFVVAGFLMITPAIMAAEAVPDSERVNNLLSEAKMQAFALREDAATMESFTRMNLAWASHVAKITLIKEHINAIGRQLPKLENARDSASLWQKTSGDTQNRPLGDV